MEVGAFFLKVVADGWLTGASIYIPTSALQYPNPEISFKRKQKAICDKDRLVDLGQFLYHSWCIISALKHVMSQ